MAPAKRKVAKEEEDEDDPDFDPGSFSLMTAGTEGAGRSLSETLQPPPLKFIASAKKKKVLVYEGHIFHHASTVKQSSYFICSQKQKGCGARIIVKNFHKQNCSYDSYVVSNGEHFNHLPNFDKIQKKEEKGRQMAECMLTDLNSPEFRNSTHLCLFCMRTLPPEYLEIRTLENILPSGDILSVPLDDPVKNSHAFDLLCSLLNVRWRRTWEGQNFDQGRCLPLCFRCQNLYQEMGQVHQQIRELETVLNGRVKVIREIIEKTESDRGKVEGKRRLKGDTTQLELLGLHVFRKKVVDPGFARFGGDTLLSTGVGDSSKVKVKSKETVAPPPAKVKLDTSDVPSLEEDANLQQLLPSIVKQEVDDVSQVLNDFLDEDGNPSWMEEDKDNFDNASITGAYSDSGQMDLDSEQESEEEVIRKSVTRSRRKRLDTDQHSEEEYRPSSTNIGATPPVEDEDEEDYGSDSSDSDFEIKRYPGRRRPKGAVFTLKSSSRSRSSFFKTARSNVARYKPRKVYTCHICSANISGYTDFMKHYKLEHPDERLFTCKFCPRHFERLRCVIIHQRNKHTGERPFQCDQCPSAFAVPNLLQKHKHVCHTIKDPEQGFPCPQCDKKFVTRAILANHRVAEHGEPPKELVYSKSKRPVKALTCHLCDAKFIGRGPFLQHYQEQHPDEKKFTCRFCSRHFPYIRECLLHQRRKHTHDRPFKCGECSKTFADERCLRKHRQARHTQGEQGFACHLCPKKYYTKTSLTVHMYSHEESVVICKSCGKVFRSQNKFEKHNNYIHDGKAERTEPLINPTQEVLESVGFGTEIKVRKKCHVCMDPIAGKIHLLQHFQDKHPTHKGGTTTCGHCGKKWPTYKDCFNHSIRVHFREKLEKNYQCDKCPKSFPCATELQKHGYTHIPKEERQKKHVCSVCGVGLASLHCLNEHMKVHEKKTEPFVCDICGKQYQWKKGLHEHTKKQHLNIRPHICKFCGKGFTLPSILQQHLNVHTMETPYTCEVCGKDFPYTGSLSRHKREVHNAKHARGQTPRKRKSKGTDLPTPQTAVLSSVTASVNEERTAPGGDRERKQLGATFGDFTSIPVNYSQSAPATTALYTPQLPHFHRGYSSHHQQPLPGPSFGGYDPGGRLDLNNRPGPSLLPFGGSQELKPEEERLAREQGRHSAVVQSPDESSSGY